MIHLPDVRCGVGGEDGVRRAGRRRTAAPRAAEVVVERGMDQLRRSTAAVRRDGPRELRFEIHLVHHVVERVAHGNFLAVVVDAAGPRTERDDAEAVRDRCRVFRHDEEAARRNEGVGWNEIIEAAAQPPDRHVHGRVGRVVQFDERLVARVVLRVVMNLVDQDGVRHVHHGEGEGLIIGEARAVGHAQPDAEDRARPARKGCARVQHIATDADLRVLREARHEREGVRVEFIHVDGLQSRDEVARSRAHIDIGRTEHDTRGRRGRGHHFNRHRRGRRVEAAVVDLEGERVEAIVVVRRRVGHGRRQAREIAVRRRHDDAVRQIAPLRIGALQREVAGRVLRGVGHDAARRRHAGIDDHGDRRDAHAVGVRGGQRVGRGDARINHCVTHRRHCAHAAVNGHARRIGHVPGQRHRRSGVDEVRARGERLDARQVAEDVQVAQFRNHVARLQ